MDAVSSPDRHKGARAFAAYTAQSPSKGTDANLLPLVDITLLRCGLSRSVEENEHFKALFPAIYGLRNALPIVRSRQRYGPLVACTGTATINFFCVCVSCLEGTPEETFLLYRYSLMKLVMWCCAWCALFFFPSCAPKVRGKYRLIIR